MESKSRRRTARSGRPSCSAHKDGLPNQSGPFLRTCKAAAQPLCRSPGVPRTEGPAGDVIEGSTMDAKSDTTKTGTLTVGNQNWSFPIYDGTIGPSVIDISKL